MSSPSNRAPRNVSGRLRSRPIIAAAYAFTINNAIGAAARSIVPTNKIPLSAASEQPIAHASIEERSGTAPWSAASGRSSTAARIAMPERVWYRK